jgi:hypothetical protein
MGTQQILLIVLSVIIVGAAIAVGIQMFNAQSYSANKAAIAAEAQSYASQIVQYYKTPESQGGAGGDLTSVTPDKIGSFIGWGGAENTDGDSGRYKISDVTATEVEITGIGTEVKNGYSPKIVTTISFPEGIITAVPSDDGGTTGF